MKRFVALSALTVCMACSTAGVDNNKDLTRTERAKMLVGIANGALNEGDATGALETLMRAEKEDSRLPELHHSKALAFFAKHDLVSATAEARKAIELAPGYADANNTLGKLLIDQGKPKDAVPFLSLAANDPLYRDAFKPLTNLGILSYRQGDYVRAEGYLSRAVMASPAAACVAYYYRGHLRLREARFQDAVKDYESAGKHMCAGFADANLAVGIAYERSKQFEMARKTFLDVQSRYPNTQVAEQAMNHLRYLP